MVLTRKDIPQIKQVLDYAKKNPLLQPVELYIKIKESEDIPESQIKEILRVYYKAKRGARNIKTDVENGEVIEAIWRVIEEIRREEANFRRRENPVKRRRETQGKNGREHAEKTWKELLALAQKDPEKHWVQVDREPELANDLSNATTRTGGGTAREKWFREQFAQDSGTINKISRMLSKIQMVRAQIAGLKIQERNARVNEHWETLRRREALDLAEGRTTKWKPKPSTGVAGVFTHGINSKGLKREPKGNKPRGGGMGTAPTSSRQYRLTRRVR